MSLVFHRSGLGIALLGCAALLPISCGDASDDSSGPSGGKGGAHSGGRTSSGASAGQSGGGTVGGEGAGGDGGSGGNRDAFLLSGVLDGLVGDAVVLRSGGELLSVTADGPFAFKASLLNGTAFHVEIATQPTAPHQACAVVNGEGVIQGADVTNVLVRCGRLPRYLLVADEVDASVSSFALDSASGRATFVGKARTGDSPVAIAVERSGQYAYVANAGEATVSQYAVDERGALTALDPPSVSVDAHPNAVLADASGAYVYVADSGNEEAIVFRADARGRLTRLGSGRKSAGKGPRALALHPSGRFLYALNELSSSITPFPIGDDGSLGTAGAAIATGPKPRAIALDPSGRFAYVANAGNNTVSAYTVASDGSLIRQASPALATGVEPSGMAIDGSGSLLLVANAKQAVLSQFAIGADGALAALGDVAIESASAAVAIDPTAQFAFASSSGTNGVSQFAASPTGVSSNSPPRVAAQRAPSALAFVAGNSFVQAASRFAYVPNVSSNSVSWYVLSAGGGLEWKGDVPAGAEPVSVALSPDGRQAYVLNTDAISLAQIATDGTLTIRDTLPLTKSSSPTSMLVHPSGRSAYVIDSLRRIVSQYAVASDGALESLTPAELALSDVGRPTAMAIDPSGRFALIALNDDTIQQFTIALDGSLAPNVAPVLQAGRGPNGLIIDPSGRYAYVANAIAGNLALYSLDATGSLLPLTPATVAADIYPAAIALNSVVGAAYAANAKSATVTQYRWGTEGAFTALAPAYVVAGMEGVDSPNGLAIRADGAAVYVVNSTSTGGVFQYSVNADGTLTPLSPPRVKTGALPASITLLNEFR